MESEPKIAHQPPVIDYGTASHGHRYRRIAFIAGTLIRRYWFVALMVIAVWLSLGRWRAGVLARRSIGLYSVFPLDRLGKNRVWILSSFGDDDVPYYRATVIKASIGNVSWTPIVTGTLNGKPMHIGSNRSESFIDTVPNSCLPPAGGTLTITYTLDVTAWPNPRRSFFYFGSVTERVDKSVTVKVLPGSLAPSVSATLRTTAPSAGATPGVP